MLVELRIPYFGLIAMSTIAEAPSLSTTFPKFPLGWLGSSLPGGSFRSIWKQQPRGRLYVIRSSESLRIGYLPSSVRKELSVRDQLKSQH